MKKIIHIDMDCFYAAVEMRDNPALQQVPLAIGGSPDGRGVIATCNYPARRFGIRSAMATAQALKLCPGLTVMRGNMAKYRAVSQQLHAIFHRYTDIIEPLSLDEAYLDVTDCDSHQGSATRIAEAIRHTIRDELSLTASAGVAPIKFLAKVASDINKPDGLCVITPDEVDTFVAELPLQCIPGVGRVTLTKLHELNLFTCRDVQCSDHGELIQRFGKFGQVLWQRAHGIDRRPVQVERIRKSVGVERTLSQDLAALNDCLQWLDTLYEELQRRLEKADANGRICRQGVKLKFNDFQTTTVAHRCERLDRGLFDTLLHEAFYRGEGRAVRLIGLSVGLGDDNDPQLSLLA
ncbi:MULTISPECIES: DNA polymerase IV [Salinivibrio]|uniref:DNA polymerase IV n=1 Tax=Salinivibrio proteolyticus TaxID=334715 RepID=A0ABY7LGX5_9GAMM|nr:MULTISPECIES: DNA polymerase IV [Salinivibrio]OOF18285.1 DNA polymerase IV [Salinivibrio sp. PR932]OOF21455.1 DNA polymerase IV [Salinivibrio sp. IB574]OOF28404.1 DNA polymerase IV [Salinivibrio sp. IB872]OOF32534.1 DNA polymerase IV [Salinivibrio proteolyticus]PCE69127.1 DNA polymerase IV [Salinivibrio sp. YCSC6]